jgi:hypothetical protein
MESISEMRRIPDPTVRPKAPMDQFRSRGNLWIAVLGVFFLISLAFVLSDFDYSNPASARADHLRHHLPGVIAYSGETAIDPKAYSPNIPGYYMFFGMVRRWITHSIVGLRLANFLVTAGLALTLASAVGGECQWRWAPFLVGPFLFSESVFTRGIWLGTDNPAWWGVLLILLMALRRRMDAITTLFAGALALATIAVRQNQIWIVPFMMVAALIGPDDQPRLDNRSLRRAVGMATAMLPVILMTSWFVFRWHGLVAPGFKGEHQGLSLAAIPMTFALLGIFGVFYASALRPELYEKRREDAAGFARCACVGLLVGVAAGVCAATNYGIWLIARVTPVVFGRSIAIALLAAVGGVIGALFLLLLPRRDRWIFGAGVACFVIVQCAHPAEFERYYEPLILMMLALATSRIAGKHRSPASWGARAAGPVTLTLIQAGYTAWRLSVPA